MTPLPPKLNYREAHQSVFTALDILHDSIPSRYFSYQAGKEIDTTELSREEDIPTAKELGHLKTMCQGNPNNQLCGLKPFLAAKHVLAEQVATCALSNVQPENQNSYSLVEIDQASQQADKLWGHLWIKFSLAEQNPDKVNQASQAITKLQGCALELSSAIYVQGE